MYSHIFPLSFLFFFTVLCIYAHKVSNADNSERFIEWTKSSPPGQFLINVTVNGIAFDYTAVDTGSTGFLISAKDLHYDDEADLQKCCKPAFEFLSSSRKFYEGYWLPSTIAFTSVAGTTLKSHMIDVFAVTQTGNCSSFKAGRCTKGAVEKWPVGRPHYMGIGFGRWNDEQPDATADKNAFLNIDFGADQTLGRGYVISDQGVVLGVRPSELADGWSLTKLAPNTAGSGDRPEWNGPPMCVEVDGSACFNGTALFDTGILYALLGVPPAATMNVNETRNGRVFLKDGTEVTVKIGSHGKYDTEFSFRTGKPDNDNDNNPNVNPDYVRLVAQHPDGAWFNSGRHFYDGFDLIFDDENGYVGLKRKETEGETQQIPVEQDL